MVSDETVVHLPNLQARLIQLSWQLLRFIEPIVTIYRANCHDLSWQLPRKSSKGWGRGIRPTTNPDRRTTRGRASNSRSRTLSWAKGVRQKKPARARKSAFLGFWSQCPETLSRAAESRLWISLNQFPHPRWSRLQKGFVNLHFLIVSAPGADWNNHLNNC